MSTTTAPGPMRLPGFASPPANPMRSLLFVPADSERKLARALSSGADVLLLDLEDSVAPDRKAHARAMAREFVASAAGQDKRPRLYVRINPLSTGEWQADLAGIVGPATGPSSGAALPDGVMLPKTTSGENVHQLSVALGHAEARIGPTGGDARDRMRIIAIAGEAAVSVLALSSYIGASSRLAGLTWGPEDLSVELGSSTNREADGRFTSPYRLVRDLTLITAAAAEVAAIDTVYVDFRSSAGLAAEAATAARDGFSGKMAIHPDQVAIINAAFTPSQAEVERARAVIAAFGNDPAVGVASLDGAMLDRPHLRRAERVLARAGQTAG